MEEEEGKNWSTKRSQIVFCQKNSNFEPIRSHFVPLSGHTVNRTKIQKNSKLASHLTPNFQFSKSRFFIYSPPSPIFNHSIFLFKISKNGPN